MLSLLLPNHIKIRDQIEHVLDMDLIKQQMDNQTFDYQQYALFIIEIMSKLCAPARDTSIEQLKSVTEPVELFKYEHFFIKYKIINF